MAEDEVLVPAHKLAAWARCIDDEIDLDGVSADIKDYANEDPVGETVLCLACDGFGDFLAADEVTCPICGGTGELKQEELIQVGIDLLKAVAERDALAERRNQWKDSAFPRIEADPHIETKEVARLVSPNGFDGQGLVPEKVIASAKRLAQLRVQFINQWTPGTESSLTTREVEELFDAAAVQAEWIRELYAARDALAERLQLAEAVCEVFRDYYQALDEEPEVEFPSDEIYEAYAKWRDSDAWRKAVAGE